ncbi:hypothetical protein B0H14DRAFT_2639646 [Mycena olivaceomarginata]|nr:hypothetical protein B0H14DRAFT_2639646 [Mycena olivaceomarginata]
MIATPTTWDGWPDRRFQCSFSPQNVMDTNQLEMNWVCETLKGRRGSLAARTSKKGKEMCHKCIGMLECTSRACSVDMVIAPAARGIDQSQTASYTMFAWREIAIARCTSTASSLSDSEESWHGIQGTEDEERESGSRDEDALMVLAFLRTITCYLFGFGADGDGDLPVYELNELGPRSVPLYNETGGIYGYLASDDRPPHRRRAPREDTTSTLVQRSERRDVRTTPYPRPTVPTHTPPHRANQPVPPHREMQQWRGSSSRTLHLGQESNRDHSGDAEWDGWPDGDFSRLFSLEEAEALDNLRAHWACEPMGGSGSGSAEADTWSEGKVTRCKCQGVIVCTSRTCNLIVRPQTRTAGIRKQLETPCSSCGGVLAHERCNVISVLRTFKHGVYYQNGGFHLHERPTVRLHMLPKEKKEFSKIMEQNPSAGPLKLLVGPPGVDGPGESVANITPVLFNAEWIRYERRKILKGSHNPRGDNFVKEFAKFDQNHPDFILEAQFDTFHGFRNLSIKRSIWKL